MRLWLLFLVGIFCIGCTHIALERRTVNQASTLTDLQYQQVLNNLAMFACNPDAMAWHLKLTAGSIQVADQGTGMFGMQFGGGKPSMYSPTLTGQRGVLNQWTVIPAVDPDDLEPLQLAFQKALNPLDEDGSLRDAMYAQVSELSVKYNIPLTREILNKLVDHMKPDIDPPTQQPRKTEEEFRARQWDLKRKNKELHDEQERQFDELAKLSKLPSREEVSENTTSPQVMTNGATRDLKGAAFSCATTGAARTTK